MDRTEQLMVASRDNDVAAIRRLIHSGVSVSAPDSSPFNYTALHWAAVYNRTEAIQVLLEAGADFTARAGLGQTPLHLAAARGSTEAAEQLIQAGCPLSQQTDNNNTALHLAAWEGRTDTVKALLAAGADITLLNNNNNTALHLAAMWGRTDTVKVLLAAGADTTLQDKHNNTALHLAAYNGRTDTVKVLLAAGADTTLLNNDNNTALHLAVAEKKDKVAETLMKHDVISLGLVNNRGQTPADGVKPSLLAPLLDSAVKESCYRRLQVRGCTLKFDANMTAASKQRKDILGRVTWSDSLVFKLSKEWGLSTDSIDWLWRPLETRQRGMPSCDIIHPVDAVLVRCLSEVGQPEVGKALRELLRSSKESWLSAWKAGAALIRMLKLGESSGITLHLADGEIHASEYIGFQVGSTPSAEAGVKARAVSSACGSPIEKYLIRNSPSGKALIISNIFFEGRQDLIREGAQNDEKRLQTVLTMVGFDVKLQKNKTRDQIRELVEEFASSSNHTKGDAAVLAIMSHGTENGILGTDMEPLHTEEIIRCFSNQKAKSLRDKPKWLILSSCRGELSNRPVLMENSPVPEGVTPRAWMTEFSDIYITYATLPNTMAWMDPHVGSWLIRVLCEQLRKYWQSLSLDDIHLLVHREVMKKVRWNASQTMETSQRGWTKRLYFTKESAMATLPASPKGESNA